MLKLENKLQKFITKAKAIHGEKYDYSKVEYKRSNINVVLICPDHGEFLQRPNNHISQKSGCGKCANNLNLTSDEFIKKANIIHNNKYTYSLTNYKNANTKVIVTCKQHGEFEIIAKRHTIFKLGCKKCSSRQYLTTDEFIQKSSEIHNNLYDYSKVEFIDMFKKIIIICKKHGEFEQQPGNHIHSKQGCPICKLSKGELQIINFLKNNNINYCREKTFKDCKDKSLLKFDFYIQDSNICIEYDGLQHFESSNFFGGEVAFLNCQRRDLIKTNYCSKNNIKLIRIAYTENVEKILLKEILNGN